MEISSILKLFVSIFFIVAALMAKYSTLDGWTSLKKYWKLLLAGGIISLLIDLYKIFK